jgi:hypothetical protein
MRMTISRCVNTLFGRRPQKDGNDKPLYDYQQIIFDSLDGVAVRYGLLFFL